MTYASFESKNRKRDKKASRKNAMVVDGASIKRIQVALAQRRLLDKKRKTS